MKISPVAGTPTISQPSATGLAPEKLERIKGLAAGKPTPEPTEEEKQKLLAATQNTIKMNVNKTPESSPMGESLPNSEIDKPETTVSDPNVQAIVASEDTQPLSPQLAQLARQRRDLQVKERDIAGREKAIADKARAELIAQLQSQPLGVLQEHGVTYDKLTNDILAAQGQLNPEVEKLKAEVDALKKGVDKRFSDTELAQETHAINYVADKLDALTGQGDDFELLKAAAGEEEVIRRIYFHWKKTGKELDVAAVAKEYQEELAEEAARYAKLGLVQKRLTPIEPLQPQTTTPQSQPQGMRTLTNKDSARPSMDRRQRAILAMQGQLKR